VWPTVTTPQPFSADWHSAAELTPSIRETESDSPRQREEEIERKEMVMSREREMKEINLKSREITRKKRKVPGLEKCR
jgi:hypothetical protein